MQRVDAGDVCTVKAWLEGAVSRFSSQECATRMLVLWSFHLPRGSSPSRSRRKAVDVAVRPEVEFTRERRPKYLVTVRGESFAWNESKLTERY